jgi:hypothetical protein
MKQNSCHENSNGVKDGKYDKKSYFDQELKQLTVQMKGTKKRMPSCLLG